MNSSSSRVPRPKSPKYGRCALLTLISLPVFHGVSYLLNLFLLTQLKDQMILDENQKGLDWVMLVYAACMLVLLVVFRSVIYYRDNYRRECYLYETSVNRFGHRGADKALRRYDGILWKEALIILGIHAAVWMPSALLHTLAQLEVGGAGLASASAVLQEVFVGVAGLYRPFMSAWIGYAIGVVFVPLCYVIVGFFIHRKWSEQSYD